MKNYLNPVFALVLLLTSCIGGQQPYQDADLSWDERAEDLVGRMNLDEKVSQMRHEAAAIPHLGIPEYNWWNECLHGVARSGRATVFPQAIGMAASFDRDLMLWMADITSTEARAKFQDYQARGKYGYYQGLTFWSPNVNIFRDPRWGRGHETYGEDPYLSGEMGLQFVRGLQGDDQRYLKTVATAKHYAVHSGPESNRHHFNANTSETDLRETYLPAFRKLVMQGHVQSVMCAYNAYDGEPCCSSSPLQEEILRGEWGFDGYIVSDCGAINDIYSGHEVEDSRKDAAARGVLGGTDLNCGSAYPYLSMAVREGLLAEREVDQALKRLMTARLKLGMFDDPEQLPWAGMSLDTVNCESHKRVALEMARKSMVLLENKGGNLPLDTTVRRIAVIGPNADNELVLLANYNGIPFEAVTVLEGIRARAGEGVEVRYARGCRHHEELPYLETLPAGFLSIDAAGELQGMQQSIYAYRNGKRQEKIEVGRSDQVNIYYDDGELPLLEAEEDAYVFRWKGYFQPDASGIQVLGLDAKYGKLIINGDTLIRINNVHRSIQKRVNVKVREGQAVQIEVLMEDRQGDANCQLLWEDPRGSLAWEAYQAALWADQVVMVMGLTPWLEGEEMKGMKLEGFDQGDRTSISLPRVQRQLIHSVASAGKPVTLVLMSGSALAVGGEASKVHSVLQAWYGGETAGTAVADLLFGDYNPAGRLPLTFYRSVDDLPPFEDYSMQGRTYRYFEDEVLYPFGYGLSYSTFEYANLQPEKQEIGREEEIRITVEVSNTGGRDGEEVVQLYLVHPEACEGRPLRSLKGFERVFLKAGQSKVVSLPLGPQELEYFDPAAGQYRVFTGSYRVEAGPSSDTISLLSCDILVK